MRSLILITILCIIVFNFLIKNLLKKKTLNINEIPVFKYNSLYFYVHSVLNLLKIRKTVKKSMRSIILISIPHIILYKFLIQNLLKKEKPKNQ